MSKWKLDADHSAVEFKVQHLGISWVRGLIYGAEGEIDFEPGKLENLKFSATINLNTINSGNAARDGHLKSADFFETTKFPTAIIKSTTAESVDKDSATFKADLTIKDITKEITLEVKYLGSQEKVKQDGAKVMVAAFTATTKINREDFGLSWNVDLPGGKVLVGKEVELNIDTEAIQ